MSPEHPQTSSDILHLLYVFYIYTYMCLCDIDVRMYTTVWYPSANCCTEKASSKTYCTWFSECERTFNEICLASTRQLHFVGNKKMRHQECQHKCQGRSSSHCHRGGSFTDVSTRLFSGPRLEADIGTAQMTSKRGVFPQPTSIKLLTNKYLDEQHHQRIETKAAQRVSSSKTSKRSSQTSHPQKVKPSLVDTGPI